ncbi:MAG: phosphomannomutase/phosphoglucomutase [bacterium]
MKDNIFRMYDIRGIVGTELKIDQAYDLGKAIITYYKQIHPETTSIIIGRDGRTHSPDITQNIIQAAIDMGFDVTDIGIVPTPVLYFAVQHLNNKAGIAITASHNTKEYNGIKMWGISGDKIQDIKHIYHQKNFYENKTNKRGTVTQQDICSIYIDYLVENFAHLKNKKLNAVIDCGNGSAGAVMPQLIKKMGWQNVSLLFPEIDGTFPNHEADPTVPENMEHVKHALAQDQELVVGIGFDGDADRMNPMTPSGKLVPGDELLALFAQKIARTHPNSAVVFDIKSSSGLIEVLEKLGSKPIISPSGHSYIKKAIKEHNAVLAGELSCHFFFADRYFGYDDGIYAAMRLIEIIDESQQTFEKLLSAFPAKISSPEIRMKCSSDEEKTKIVDHVKTIFAARPDVDAITIDGIRVQMSYGWGLIRVSNTQPVICLRFESGTKDGLTQVKQDFYNAMLPYFDAQKLKDSIEL